MSKLPRYVETRQIKSGLAYYFCPPRALVRNYMAQNEALGTDREVAFARAKELNDDLDARGTTMPGLRGKGTSVNPKVTLIKEDSLEALVHFYFTTAEFTDKLKAQSKRVYKNALKQALNMVVDGKRFGDYKVEDIRRPHVAMLRDAMKEQHGVSLTISAMRCLKRLVTVCMVYERVSANPFSGVDIPTQPTRSQTWKPEQIKVFCAHAKLNGRESVAKAVKIAYATAQRVSDVLLLQSKHLVAVYDDDTGEEERFLHITQSKTGIEVMVPVSDPEIIRWFDEAPSEDSYIILRETNGDTYSYERFHAIFTEIKKKAGLGDLWFHDIRRTVATEMGQGGATHKEMMSVGGWKTAAIVDRYAQRDIKAAKGAIAKRSTFLAREAERSKRRKS